MDKKGLLKSLKFVHTLGMACFWTGLIIIGYLHGWRTAIAIYLIVFSQNAINKSRGLIDNAARKTPS